MATTFSEHARQRLLELYNKHDHEVGRVLKEEHPELYKAFTPTDCITTHSTSSRTPTARPATTKRPDKSKNSARTVIGYPSI